MRFVTFKRGGQPGRVAINAALVTDVRSSMGPYTDIFMGEHLVAVEGAFEQVVAKLAGEPELNSAAPREFLKRA